MDKEMRKLKRTMRRQLVQAYRGWWFWHRLVRRYRLGRTKVVLLPGKNTAYNYTALLYLDQMLREQGFKNAIILTTEKTVARAAELFSKNILSVELIRRGRAERLMQFYCLYEFDVRFVVASLEEPEGRNAAGLIGKNGTTIGELMAIGVYKIAQFQKEKPPVYIGNDPEIQKFLTEGERSSCGLNI